MTSPIRIEYKLTQQAQDIMRRQLSLTRRAIEYPSFATSGAAAVDLRCMLRDGCLIEPQHRLRIPTGLRVAIPAGYVGLVTLRSGVAWKPEAALLMTNAPGIIDPDYRGEIKVVVTNTDQYATGDSWRLGEFERFAQLTVVPAPEVTYSLSSIDWPNTGRGSDGFGSTGAQ